MSLMRVVLSVILLLSSVNIFAAAKAPNAAQAPKNAIESASGIYYVVLQPAKAGAKAIKQDFFEYRVTAWNKNEAGKYIAKDGGLLRGSFNVLAKTSPVVARAVMMTPVGETRRWWFTNPQAPAASQILDLTVLGNVDPAPAPSDVATVPTTANKTASGLAYRVIKKGSGASARPTLQSMITIDYSGWTPDGKLFDSSVTRGEKATFPLSGLIKGWQEGVQLMGAGDTYRFWIPGHLAYDGNPNPGTPKGMLVFDVTLYSFEP
jgi:hypothetical protein